MGICVCLHPFVECACANERQIAFLPCICYQIILPVEIPTLGTYPDILRRGNAPKTRSF